MLVARRAELLERSAAGIRAKGGEALTAPSDLTQETAVTALFAKVKSSYGRLDVLVNNAGIATHQNTEDITARRELAKFLPHKLSSAWLAGRSRPESTISGLISALC